MIGFLLLHLTVFQTLHWYANNSYAKAPNLSGDTQVADI